MLAILKLIQVSRDSEIYGENVYYALLKHGYIKWK